MGIYREHFIVSEGDLEWDTWDVFEQPALRRASVVVLEAITDHTHGLEWRLDPFLERLHERHCDHDCRLVKISRIKDEWTTPEGMARRAALGDFVTPESHPDKWTTTVERRCARLPFCASVDLWVYRYAQKGRRLIGKVESSERRPLGGDELEPLTWKQRLLKRWEK